MPEGEAFSHALESLANRYPSAMYHQIENASHYVIASHTKEIANHLEAWVTSF